VLQPAKEYSVQPLAKLA